LRANQNLYLWSIKAIKTLLEILVEIIPLSNLFHIYLDMNQNYLQYKSSCFLILIKKAINNW
jgi:hypothetical protein